MNIKTIPQNSVVMTGAALSIILFKLKFFTRVLKIFVLYVITFSLCFMYMQLSNLTLGSSV